MIRLRTATLSLLLAGTGTLSWAQAQSSATTITMFAGPYTPTAATTVTTQNPRVVTALKLLADRFEKQTGIHIVFVNPAVNGTDNGIDRPKWEAYLQASIAANTAPDITYVPQGPDQSGKGWFMPLDDLFAKPNAYAPGNRQWKTLFYPKVLAGLTGVGGQSYLIPYASNYPYVIIGTFYNKALLAKAGITSPPKTWEEWMTQLARIKAAGIAPMAPFPAESKTGSVWPMWSTLIPAFTAHLISKVDTDKNGTVSQEEIARAVLSGVISNTDPHLQAAWLQYKRQLSYYLPGWNAADIPSAWNQGKVAQKYGGFWEIYAEKSNTQRKFDWGFFPTLPVTKASSPLVTWTPKLAPTGKARLDGISTAVNEYAVVDASVKRNNNLDAVSKWLQFITTPDANEFVVNENPDAIPGVRGANPDPLWNQLADLPVADFGSASVYPYALDQDQQTFAQREVTLWALGQITDKAFFDALQKDMKRAATAFLAKK